MEEPRESDIFGLESATHTVARLGGQPCSVSERDECVQRAEEAGLLKYVAARKEV